MLVIGYQVERDGIEGSVCMDSLSLLLGPVQQVKTLLQLKCGIKALLRNMSL